MPKGGSRAGVGPQSKGKASAEAWTKAKYALMDELELFFDEGDGRMLSTRGQRELLMEIVSDRLAKEVG